MFCKQTADLPIDLFVYIMGRTRRLRRRRRKLQKRIQKTETFDDENTDNNVGEKVITDLLRWLKPKSSVTKLATFDLVLNNDSEAVLKVRGLMAKKSIHPGEALVQIPVDKMITRESVLKQLPKLPSYWSTQLILSTFLLIEDQKGSRSKWRPYLATLPRSYDVPHFELKGAGINSDILPRYLRRKVVEQSDLVSRMKSTLLAWRGRQSNVDSFDENKFDWAWFTVNTRAIYFEDGHDSLALAPYLDMFNHSPNVQVETGIVGECYQIVAKNPTKKFDQVFINYGGHDNTKLYLEYGFVLDDNPHDLIPVQEQDLGNGNQGHDQADNNMHIVDSDYIDDIVSWNVLLRLNLLTTNSGQDLNAIPDLKLTDERFASKVLDLIQAKRSEIGSALKILETKNQDVPVLRRLLQLHYSIADRALSKIKQRLA